MLIQPGAYVGSDGQGFPSCHSRVLMGVGRGGGGYEAQDHMGFPTPRRQSSRYISGERVGGMFSL